MLRLSKSKINCLINCYLVESFFIIFKFDVADGSMKTGVELEIVIITIIIIREGFEELKTNIIKTVIRF